jgi:hypothetical protein
MGRVGKTSGSGHKSKFEDWTISDQRQYPPMLDQKFVITMCERALSSERSQDHSRILQDCSSTIQSFHRERYTASRVDLSVGNDKESRECLKFLVNKLVEVVNKIPFCDSP